MKKSNELKEVESPGWANLDRYDFFWSIYVMWFVFALALFFQASSEFESYLNVKTNIDRLLLIYTSFLVIAVTTSTFLGIKGTGVVIWRSIVSPMYTIYYVSSFFKQSYKTIKKLRSNFPMKLVYFGSLPIIYILGVSTTNLVILKILFIMLSLHLVVSLMWGVQWSLNPFDFLKYLNFLKNTKLRSTFALNLVKLDKTEKEVTLSALLKKIEILRKFVVAYELVVKKFTSNKALFSCFLIVLFGVSLHMIFGGSILLRAGDLIAAPEGFIVKNKFFEGSFSDYLYISVNTFLPSEKYGIEFVNKDSRWILTFVTMSSYLLLVIAIAGFGMAGTNKVEETVGSFTKDLHSTFDDVASLLKEADEKKLLSSPKDKKSNNVVEVNSNTTDFVQ